MNLLKAKARGLFQISFALTFVVLLSTNSAYAQKACADLFTKGVFSSQKIDLNQMVSDLAVKPSIPLNDVAPALAAHHDSLIKKIGMSVSRSTRETNIKLMESFLRQESHLKKNKILSSEKIQNYDAIIVGGGPHGLFALAGLLKEKPNAKVLMLAQEDTVGATFREGYIFNINSSNKASGEGKPLPGLGNINELPNLPIQVSELSSARYPEAADLGDALVANAYALLKTYKNVDLLFGSNVDIRALRGLAEKRGDRSDGAFPVTFNTSSKSKPTVSKLFKTKYTIAATGLGEPKDIDNFTRRSSVTNELRKVNPSGLAKVMTFEEIARLLADTENPWELLKDKKIAIVGSGNSADVIAEFLLGLAAPSAYGSASAQQKALPQILWIGQALDTCKKFLDQQRNRYSSIASGFKSSSAEALPAIQAFPGKLFNLGVAGGPQNRVTLGVSEAESVPNVDLVIVTTGFDSISANNFINDLSPLEVKTTVSAGNPTRVALTNNDATFLVTGPSVRLPVESDLKGVIQNFVSLFNNAPRSSATGKYVAERLNAEQKEAMPETEKSKITLKPSVAIQFYDVQVEGLEKFPNRDFKANPYFTRLTNFDLATYLADSFKLAVSDADLSLLPANSILKLTIVRNEQGFKILTQGFESASLIGLLASNRDFLNPFLTLLTDNNQGIQFSLSVKDGQLQENAARISSVKVDGSYATQEAEPAEKSFISALPRYIKRLFTDR